MTSTIGQNISATVTLGSANYSSPLSIAAAYRVFPTTGTSLTGIFVPITGGAIYNHGTIYGGSLQNFSSATGGGIGVYTAPGGSLAQLWNFSAANIHGGYGGKKTAGGTGVDVTITGFLHNAGSIVGGFGANGGDGVIISGGQLSDPGSIEGGRTFYDTGEAGGIGVDATGSILGVSGSVAGGFGGGQTGGIGVRLNNSVLNLSGTVTGGFEGAALAAGGLGGGAGVYLGAGSRLAISQKGVVAGGSGYPGTTANYQGGIGGAGVQAYTAGDLITNAGSITGGVGTFNYYHAGGVGGDGVSTRSGTISNTGTIAGGNGSSTVPGQPGTGHYPKAAQYRGAYGGVGVDLNGGKLTSTGAILGGNGAYNQYAQGGGGGTGVAATGSVTNGGVIRGGAAGASYFAAAGNAGPGIYVDDTKLTNTGSIIGGAGGNSVVQSGSAGGTGVGIEQSATANSTGSILGGAGGASTDANGGTGGNGVNISSGSTLTLSGTVTGGAGGYGDIGNGGAGGVGITLFGGEAIVSGIVSGGAGGASENGAAGEAGDAVYFDGTSTLIIDPGAQFKGLVAGASGSDSTLELAGSGVGTLAGLGTAFVRILNLGESTGADWVLAGTNTRGAGQPLTVNGTLSVTGSFVDSSFASIGPAGNLAVSGAGVLEIAGLTLSGGTATGAAGGKFSVGTTAGAADAITVESTGTISGDGTLAGAPIVDDGKITASSGGTLTLATAVSGTGTATIASGGVLTAAISVGGITLAFGGAGTLLLETPKSVTSTISGFASGDVIDASLVANTLTYAGGTLTLKETSGSTITTVGTLHLAGTLTAANFSLASDGHGGTDISFTTAANKPTDPIARDFMPLLNGLLPMQTATHFPKASADMLRIADMPAFHGNLLMLPHT